jgi:hypothetical protein
MLRLMSRPWLPVHRIGQIMSLVLPQDTRLVQKEFAAGSPTVLHASAVMSQHGAQIYSTDRGSR